MSCLASIHGLDFLAKPLSRLHEPDQKWIPWEPLETDSVGLDLSGQLWLVGSLLLSFFFSLVHLFPLPRGLLDFVRHC